MTRATFEERVGVHGRTVTRWIKEGILEPGRARLGRYWVQTFTEPDVGFARALAYVLKSRRGELTLAHAVAIVRSEIAPPEPGHDPKESPPLTYRSRDYLTEADRDILKMFIERHPPSTDPPR
jgi:hypothetical protein